MTEGDGMRETARGRSHAASSQTWQASWTSPAGILKQVTRLARMLFYLACQSAVRGLPSRLELRDEHSNHYVSNTDCQSHMAWHHTHVQGCDKRRMSDSCQRLGVARTSPWSSVNLRALFETVMTALSLAEKPAVTCTRDR